MIDDLKPLLTNEVPEQVEFNGNMINLNEPFHSEENNTRYAVYSRNANNDIVLVRFGVKDIDYYDATSREKLSELHRCGMEHDKSTPSYWVCKLLTSEVPKPTIMLAYDSATKSLTSVRDGYQLYAGFELADVTDQSNRTYTFYRSPETITSMTKYMDNLPITIDHVDVGTVKQSDIVGRLKSVEVIEYNDSQTQSTLMLKHTCMLDSKTTEMLKNGGWYLSLGYNAQVREHEEYDFEQHSIVPDHLAIVRSPRGGYSLTFNDNRRQNMDEKKKEDVKSEKKTDDVKKNDVKTDVVFSDIAGVTVETIDKLIAKFGEAVKKSELERINKIAPLLIKFIEEAGVSMETDDTALGEVDMDIADQTGETVGVEDAGLEVKEKFTDATFQRKVTDTVKIIEKAKKFLPSNYNFADKTGEKIMSDTLTHQTGLKFAETDLNGAFAMLKEEVKTTGFVDSNATKWNKVKGIEDKKESK